MTGLTASQKARAETLMTYFENDSPTPVYDFAALLGDGRGYTCGRAGFTTRDGDWYRVVADYTARVPSNPLAPFLPRLKELADSFSNSVTGLETMPAAIRQAAADPLFQRIQDAHQDSDSYLPAMAHATELGVTKALTKAALYDACLLHGDADDPDGVPALIARTNTAVHGSPAQGVPESTWLQAFLDVRQADMENPAAVATRAEWTAATDRINIFRLLVASGNWDLSQAIDVHGRDHTIQIAAPLGHATRSFAGASTQFQISSAGDGATVTVTDKSSGAVNNLHVGDINYIGFSDKTVVIGTADDANIARLYSAALNRLPDAQGLNEWMDIYSNNISAVGKAQGLFAALAQLPARFNGAMSIAAGFTNSAEFQQKYGTLSDQQYVAQLYSNVLNRPPENAGLSSWLSLMHQGDSSGTVYTREMVLVGFAESPENIAKSSAWLFHP